MHASLAFVNGARIAEREDLRLLNTLLSSSAAAESTRPGKDRGKPKSKPGSFKNDPPDPKNPNEVRERHLKKIKR
jgi:hypothetical protein